jgi:uncharacterized protein YdeI (YjbR/CyaY-like superfamily)
MPTSFILERFDNGMHYILLDKKHLQHYRSLKTKGSRVTATFSEDDSAYQFEVPEEFQEVLSSDPEAEKIFHSLTMGNQRGLIYLVTQVKSVDKRIERSLKIADRIKHGMTSPKTVLK